MQGDYRFTEQLNRHRVVMNLEDVAPRLAHPTYIAPTAHVAGDVSLGAGVSVWPGAVIRGDASAVAVGARSAIRERAVVAVVRQGVPTRSGDGGSTGPTPGQGGGADDSATRIGADVMVGCGATIHAATLKDGAVVGAGAVVGGGAVVGEKAVVGAGSVLAPGTIVPPATLYAGSPAVRVRALSDEELSSSAAAVAEVGRLSLVHAAAGVPPDVAAALGVPTSSSSKTAIA